MRTKAPFRLVLATALGIALVAPLLLPTPAQAAQTGVLLGIYRQPRDGSWSETSFKTSMSQLETYLGRKVDLDHHYYSWGASFPTWRETYDANSGRYPLISWQGTYTSQVANGDQDTYIRARADAIKTFGKKVFLEWFWEMDAKSTWTLNRVPSAASFISAWRHIYTIFHNRGATNALFVWCPNAYWFTTGRSQTFYPGDAYVDWTCADGYNWAPSSGSWTSFHDVFKVFYNWASLHPQPIMIGETGTQEWTSGMKSTWITDMRNTLKTQYTKIHAIVWFDAKYTSNSGGMYDWRVDTTTGSYSSFKNLGLDTYFRPLHQA